jgi:hypothetical protein
MPRVAAGMHMFLFGGLVVEAFLITWGLLSVFVIVMAWLILTKPHPELPPMTPERQRELLIALAEQRRKRKERRNKK